MREKNGVLVGGDSRDKNKPRDKIFKKDISQNQLLLEVSYLFHMNLVLLAAK